MQPSTTIQPSKPKWTVVRELCGSNMKEARELAKSYDNKHWCWAKSPGDGVRFSVLQCNDHVNCGKLIRVAKTEEDKYVLQEKGEHAEEKKEKQRVNSTLTYVEDEKLHDGVNQGAKPAAVLVSMTTAKAKEIKGMRGQLFQHKRPQGGLEGALLHRRVVLVCITCVSVYVLHRNCEYQVRRSQTTTDTRVRMTV
jgi:hypothetical protein|eukprot:3603487-Prymnesium_polylepis.1